MLRSTFIVDFPGRTEADEPIKGAVADPVPEEVAAERHARLTGCEQAISARRLAAKVGRRLVAIAGGIAAEGALGRSKGDAPEVDGRG